MRCMLGWQVDSSPLSFCHLSWRVLSPSPPSSPRVARFQQWCLEKWSAVVQSKLLTVRQAHEDGFRQSPVTLSCLILPTSFWWVIQLWGAPQCMSRQQIRQFPGEGFSLLQKHCWSRYSRLQPIWCLRILPLRLPRRDHLCQFWL